jgi:hypothetical protein
LEWKLASILEWTPTYQKTWLQFAFPLYIWLLVGVIIHYSTKATKVFGRNNFGILATLFLLSYTKILKTIVTALTVTEVLQGSVNDTNDELVPYRVWSYDGNGDYLKGKHVPLFVVAVVLMVCVLLPYTVLLTFGQYLRSMPTRRRCVLWCIRSTVFISIMDAYHAPYNKKLRYWTGLMLLTRCILFPVFVFSYKEDKLLINTYITMLILTAVFTLKCCIPKVYRVFGKNFLELFFLFNLMILSATLHHLKGTSSNKDILCQCTSGSISVTLVEFIGVLIYYAYLRCNKTRCFLSFKEPLVAKWRARWYRIIPAEEDIAPVLNLPTTSTVALREDLLEEDKI